MLHSSHGASNVAPHNTPYVLQRFLEARRAKNTLAAYDCDIRHFLAWGGVVPASPDMVATYLAVHADINTVATLQRRLVSISYAHTRLKHSDPVKHELVKATMQGIRRVKGHHQRRVRPILKEDMRSMVKGLRGLRGLRDKALLLVGFAGALRRSELVALQVGDVEFCQQGMLLHIRSSKTDQLGKGHTVPIPALSTGYCAVKALRRWLDASEIKKGPIFRGVTAQQQLQSRALTAHSVARIVKLRAEHAGLDPQYYAGHSLRAGLVTSAFKVGAASYKVQQQTRHSSSVMLETYIRDEALFADHPLKRIWQRPSAV